MSIVIVCFVTYILRTSTIGSDVVPDRQNNYLLTELNETNNTKLWIQHIYVPLMEILELKGEHGFHVIYKSLRSKTSQMFNWCFPDARDTNLNDSDVEHIRQGLPCGYAMIIQGIQPEYYVFRLSTASYLNVQIRFLLFDMDYTYKCSYSSYVNICVHNITVFSWQCPKSMIYCGYRKPWMMTLAYNEVALFLKQANVQKACNLTFIYTSIGIGISKVYRKHQDASVVHYLGNPMSLLYHYIFFRRPRKWLLVTKKGNLFNFTAIKTCCYPAVVEIFDGSLQYHLLYRSRRIYTSGKKLNVTTVYFVSTVHYYPDEHYPSLDAAQLFKLRFVSKTLRETYLQLDTVNRLNNNGGLLQVSLGINITSVGFPNISFVIRKFGDWNEDQCSLGGYVLRHHINTTMLKVTFDHGPFCPGSGPSAPFVGSLGPKHIVLGGFQYVFVIYAFGPWYNIDIDVIMSLSECEGVFEPLSMCSVVIPEQNIFDITRYIKASHYRLYCSAFNYETRDPYLHTVMRLFIFNISKCIIFQTISLHTGFIENYSFASVMNVNIDVNIGSAYLTAYTSYAEIFSKLVIGTLNNGTTYVPIEKDYQAKHAAVAALSIVQVNFKQTHRLLMSINLVPVAKVNKVHSCSSINSSSTLTKQETKTNLMETYIPNHCGIIYFHKQVTYLLEFYFLSSLYGRDDDMQTKSFLYTKFETLCSKEFRNILTLMGGVSHSVIHRHLLINHQHLPLHFMVDNNMGCSFTMEYRIRQFQIHVLLSIHPHYSVLRVSKSDNSIHVVIRYNHCCIYLHSVYYIQQQTTTANTYPIGYYTHLFC